MTLIFVELFLLATTLAAVAYPLLSRGTPADSDLSLIESDFSDLLYKKEAAYIALVDLDFDFRTGKINDADYRAMKSSIESDAMSLLKRIDDHEKGAISSPPEQTGDKRYCSKCGSEMKKAQQFCSDCGTKL